MEEGQHQKNTKQKIYQFFITHQYLQLIDLTNEVLKSDPKQPGYLSFIYQYRGAAFYHLKRYQQAQKCYKKCLQIFPQQCDYQNNLAATKIKLNKTKEAEKILKNIINYIDEPVYYLNLTIIAQINNLEQEYLQYSTKLSEYQKNNPNSTRGNGLVYVFQKQYQETVIHTIQLTKIFNDLIKRVVKLFNEKQKNWVESFFQKFIGQHERKQRTIKNIFKQLRQLQEKRGIKITEQTKFIYQIITFLENSRKIIQRQAKELPQLKQNLMTYLAQNMIEILSNISISNNLTKETKDNIIECSKSIANEVETKIKDLIHSESTRQIISQAQVIDLSQEDTKIKSLLSHYYQAKQKSDKVPLWELQINEQQPIIPIIKICQIQGQSNQIIYVNPTFMNTMKPLIKSNLNNFYLSLTWIIKILSISQQKSYKITYCFQGKRSQIIIIKQLIKKLSYPIKCISKNQRLDYICLKSLEIFNQISQMCLKVKRVKQVYDKLYEPIQILDKSFNNIKKCFKEIQQNDESMLKKITKIELEQEYLNQHKQFRQDIFSLEDGLSEQEKIVVQNTTLFLICLSSSLRQIQEKDELIFKAIIDFFEESKEQMSGKQTAIRNYLEEKKYRHNNLLGKAWKLFKNALN